MSLAEEARTMRQRVAARLNELAPLVREYEELLEVARELGIEVPGPAEPTSSEPASPEPAPPEPAPPEPETAAPRRQTTSRRRKRSGAASPPEPERDARVLEVLHANPGATTADVASILGVPATTLYRPVRDLTNSGAIVKRGRGLYVAS
jgi:uncharacterized membrane protein